jgi:hypothetical protein
LTFELELRDEAKAAPRPSGPFPGLPLDASEVEAEFFRLTGIVPDPTLRVSEKLTPASLVQAGRAKAASEKAADPSPFTPPSRSALVPNGHGDKNSVQLKPKTRQLKNKIVKEYLERGLGGMLCEVDEDVKRAYLAIPKDDRPKSDKQKRRFAEEFYSFGQSVDGEAAAIADVDSEAATRDALPDASSASALSLASEIENAASASAAPKPRSNKTAENGGAKAGSTAAKVKSCMPGLEWDVTISEEDRHLCATVVFGEEVWEALQGYSFAPKSSKSFREAVSFELSEQELRVTYTGSSVLELHLPQPVDATAAAAKLSSKLRKVTVRAPLSAT